MADSWGASDAWGANTNGSGADTNGNFAGSNGGSGGANGDASNGADKPRGPRVKGNFHDRLLDFFFHSLVSL